MGTFANNLNETITKASSFGLSQLQPAQLFVRIGLFLTSFLGAAGAVALIFGGLMYVLSLGDESRVARAKRIILFAIIGMIIGGVSYLGVAIVCEVGAISAPDCDVAINNLGGLTPGQFISNMLNNAANIILSFIAIAGVLAIVWGAIQYITSIGDESKTAQAKRIILYAIVGIIVAGLAGFFVSIACRLAGVTDGICTNLPAPSAIVTNITYAIRILLNFVSILAVGAIAYGAYLYITSQGQEDKSAQAKRVLFYSILGLIISALSAIIVNVVINVIL